MAEKLGSYGGIRCPKCASRTYVVDSRLRLRTLDLRRRRECPKCKHRFTTYEYIPEGQ